MPAWEKSVAGALGWTGHLARASSRAAHNATYGFIEGVKFFQPRPTVTPLTQLTGASDAIVLCDSAGTHGRRASLEPVDRAGDRASQLQIVPGDAVSQDTTSPVIQTQLLLFGRNGPDYERLLIDGRGKQFRITTSKRAGGTTRPLIFQIEDNDVSLTEVASVRPTGQFRVHTTLQLGPQGDASLSRIAADVVSTPGQFRVGTSIRAASGTAQEIQFGNVGGFGAATIMFGTDSYLMRSAENYLRTMGGFRVDGELRHNGAAVGFFGAPPVAKPTGVAATASALHSALISLGLIAA